MAQNEIDTSRQYEKIKLWGKRGTPERESNGN